LLHERIGFALLHRLAVQQPVEHGTPFFAHDFVIRMKFAIKRSPSGVNTLSG
jgi:hypothetical protein